MNARRVVPRLALSAGSFLKPTRSFADLKSSYACSCFPYLEWTSASLETRTAYINQTLTDMSDPDERLNARYRLSYLFQGASESHHANSFVRRLLNYSNLPGVFAETTSPEQQLHLVIENCRLARKCDGLARLVRNLHEATARMEAMTWVLAFSPCAYTYY